MVHNDSEMGCSSLGIKAYKKAFVTFGFTP